MLFFVMQTQNKWSGNEMKFSYLVAADIKVVILDH